MPNGIQSVAMDPSNAIEALREAGLTEKAIGSLVGVGQSTINRIRHGQMVPNYPLGRALVELAERSKQEQARAA
ncbi:hypothetical protein B9Y78_08015 [Stenotrophomonas maltophilia]|nr:hypothetical protein B9Y78_08015 [Stenotrophomonas maltophilia]